MSAAMRAGFFLVILAVFFFPSTAQVSTTTTTTPVSSTTTATTTTVSSTTTATTTTDSNSTNTTSPGDSGSVNSTDSTNSTTEKPGDLNSTVLPTNEHSEVNSTITTTPDSNSTNTTSPGDSGSVNSTDSTNSTTEKPGDLNSTVLPTNEHSEGSIATQPAATTKPEKPCETKPCGTGAAVCTEIYDGYICRCPYGYFYEKRDKSCSMGKQFFGSFTVNTPYSSEFTNVTSREYKSLYDNVTAFFKQCFENETSYAEAIITKITQPEVNSRSLKVKNGATDIEAINIFTANSTITQDNVATIINDTINNNPGLIVTVYKKSDPCKAGYCDEATTNCSLEQSNTIAVCTCKPGYSTSLLFYTSCPDCALSCTAENKKECIQNKTEKGLVPACQCLINHKPGADINDSCVQCDYGYSGVHCEDSFQLILIIVGSIAGAVVLALLGGVIALSLKSKKTNKSPDRERLINPEDNAVFGSSKSTEVTQFPRVAVKPSMNTKNASSSNPYETDEPFQRTVPTRDYDDDTDSWFEMAPKNTTFGNNSKY